MDGFAGLSKTTEGNSEDGRDLVEALGDGTSLVDQPLFDNISDLPPLLPSGTPAQLLKPFALLLSLLPQGYTTW